MQFEDLIEALEGKDIEFSIEGSVIKKGLVENVEIKTFVVKLDLLEMDGKVRKFDFPFPFAYRLKGNTIWLDYRLDAIKSLTLFGVVDALVEKQDVLNPLYDRVASIKCVPEF